MLKQKINIIKATRLQKDEYIASTQISEVEDGVRVRIPQFCIFANSIMDRPLTKMMIMMRQIRHRCLFRDVAHAH